MSSRESCEGEEKGVVQQVAERISGLSDREKARMLAVSRYQPRGEKMIVPLAIGSGIMIAVGCVAALLRLSRKELEKFISDRD